MFSWVVFFRFVVVLVAGLFVADAVGARLVFGRRRRSRRVRRSRAGLGLGRIVVRVVVVRVVVVVLVRCANWAKGNTKSFKNRVDIPALFLF